MTKQTEQQQQAAEAADAMSEEIREITAGGKTYKVRRLETRQIWPTLRAGLPIIEGLVGLLGIGEQSPAAGSPLGSGSAPTGQSLDPPKEPGALEKLVGPEVAGFITLMAEHGERVTEIIAIGVDEKVSTIGKLEPQESYALLRALIEVNRDFFSRRVAPLLKLPAGGGESLLSGAIGRALRATGAGETPSSS